MAECKLIRIIVHTVFYRHEYNTYINTECPSVQAHSLFLPRVIGQLPCFSNILKANYIWLTFAHSPKHQKASRGQTCLQKSEEKNGQYFVLHASGIIKANTVKQILGYRQIVVCVL